MTHLLDTISLKNHRRYLQWGLFNTQDSKIHEFICWVNDIVKYLYHFPLLGMDQVLPDDKIIEIVKFELPWECQKQILVQVFNLVTKSLNDLVELCEWINMDK